VTEGVHANRFTPMEWAGAFGDLGTLIPFVVAYIAVLKMDAFGVLVFFCVILFLTGAQLALGSCDFSKNKSERFIALAAAAFALWNVGLAFVVGILLHEINRRGWLRL
jgi:Molybdate transporter of MFS superfamily